MRFLHAAARYNIIKLQMRFLLAAALYNDIKLQMRFLLAAARRNDGRIYYSHRRFLGFARNHNSKIFTLLIKDNTNKFPSKYPHKFPKRDFERSREISSGYSKLTVIP